ncbi:DUF2179 domain-containing protein [Eubacteriaceae bacterium ES3]|nr:DUF2179 domain-containing protein [Eubacteriaceae bacterium ES3]
MTKLFLILFVQLLYVPMLTLRTISMVKNLKVLTGFFGFMEALIYIFGLAIVLSGEQSIIEMIVYAVGFALGLILGIYVEQKMAIGFSSLSVNIEHNNDELVEKLRHEGFGVTVYSGQGKAGKRTNLDILTRRKHEKRLFEIISEYEPKAFIMSFEPKMFQGGYLAEIMNRRSKLLKRHSSKNDSKNIFAKTVDEIKNEASTLTEDWDEE